MKLKFKFFLLELNEFGSNEIINETRYRYRYIFKKIDSSLIIAIKISLEWIYYYLCCCYVFVLWIFLKL